MAIISHSYLQQQGMHAVERAETVMLRKATNKTKKRQKVNVKKNGDTSTAKH